ncbi:hypothetical protein FOHLNKBM_0009 [Methylobacterium longum]|jgi:AhpD family alkylhydroperoxidase|nr:hypothetical protein FOHLNKBM_0009 [Methylobacterium longum]
MMKDWTQHGAALVSTLGRIGAVSPDLLEAHDQLAAAAPTER